MNWFNITAFDAGLLLFACICLQNMVMVFLCSRFGVPIGKCAVLIDIFGKHFYKTKIRNTILVVGILPLGGYLKPLWKGSGADAYNEGHPEHKKKKLHERIIIEQSVYGIWLFFILIGLFFLFPGKGYAASLNTLLNFFGSAIKALFSGSHNDGFRQSAITFFENAKILPALICLPGLMHLCIWPVQLINGEWFEASKIYKTGKYLLIPVLLLLLYIIGWKLPVLVFSFFETGEIAAVLISFFLGVYAAGILAFFPIAAFFRYAWRR
jgi:hypothetical protein